MFITMSNLDRPVAEKPRNKRTTKGLILSGARGKRARRDSRGESRAFDHRRDDMFCFCIDGKQVPSKQQAIKEQLDEGQPFVEGSRRRQRHFPMSNIAREGVVFTSESAGFRPQSPVKTQPTMPKLVERFESIDEETGLPVVIINTDDAWSLCRGPRSVRR